MAPHAIFKYVENVATIWSQLQIEPQNGTTLNIDSKFGHQLALLALFPKVLLRKTLVRLSADPLADYYILYKIIIIIISSIIVIIIIIIRISLFYVRMPADQIDTCAPQPPCAAVPAKQSPPAPFQHISRCHEPMQIRSNFNEYQRHLNLSKEDQADSRGVQTRRDRTRRDETRSIKSI